MTIEPNIGEHGTVFVTGRDMGANSVPSIVLASEHYNLVAKMLQQKIPVKLAVEIQATYDEADRNTHNVIWEIPGTDNAVKDEIVMVGAHLDSWHTATGATDNADGSATVMEAMRILKALNIRPRRTIRGALWAGEEQGLLGSRAYVAQHLAGDKNKAARDKFSVYFNLDNGFPPISGFYMEGNEPARAIMAEWLKPVASLGAIMPAPGHIGATDHLSFLDVGVPGFQAVQEYTDYDVRTHHTNVDFAERIDPNALKQASTVMAVVLYQAAMREGTFPKPPPASEEAGHSVIKALEPVERPGPRTLSVADVQAAVEDVAVHVEELPLVEGGFELEAQQSVRGDEQLRPGRRAGALIRRRAAAAGDEQPDAAHRIRPARSRSSARGVRTGDRAPTRPRRRCGIEQLPQIALVRVRAVRSRAVERVMQHRQRARAALLATAAARTRAGASRGSSARSS